MPKGIGVGKMSDGRRHFARKELRKFYNQLCELSEKTVDGQVDIHLIEMFYKKQIKKLGEING